MALGTGPILSDVPCPGCGLPLEVTCVAVEVTEAIRRTGVSVELEYQWQCAACGQIEEL